MKRIIFKGCICALIIISLTGCTSPNKPQKTVSGEENITTWENVTTSTWD